MKTNASIMVDDVVLCLSIFTEASAVAATFGFRLSLSLFDCLGCVVTLAKFWRMGRLAVRQVSKHDAFGAPSL